MRVRSGQNLPGEMRKLCLDLKIDLKDTERFVGREEMDWGPRQLGSNSCELCFPCFQILLECVHLPGLLASLFIKENNIFRDKRYPVLLA